MTKPITALPGVGDARAQDLHRLGFRTLADIANATPEALCAVPGFRTHRALQLITAARALLAEEASAPTAKSRRRTGTTASPAPAASPASKPTSRSRPARATGQKATVTTTTAAPGQPQTPAARTAPKKAPPPTVMETLVTSDLAPAPETPAPTPASTPVREQRPAQSKPKVKRARKESTSPSSAPVQEPQETQESAAKADKGNKVRKNKQAEISSQPVKGGQIVKETLKNDPISLFPPLESVIFDLAARFNPFLGSFWVF